MEPVTLAVEQLQQGEGQCGCRSRRGAGSAKLRSLVTDTLGAAGLGREPGRACGGRCAQMCTWQGEPSCCCGVSAGGGGPGEDGGEMQQRRGPIGRGLPPHHVMRRAPPMQCTKFWRMALCLAEPEPKLQHQHDRRGAAPSKVAAQTLHGRSDRPLWGASSAATRPPATPLHRRLLISSSRKPISYVPAAKVGGAAAGPGRAGRTSASRHLLPILLLLQPFIAASLSTASCF